MGVKTSELSLQRRRILGDCLDVVAEPGEEVPGELVHAGRAVDVQGRAGKLGLDVVNNLLHGVDGLVAVNYGLCKI